MRSYERIFIGLQKVLNYLDTFKFTNKMAVERIISKQYQQQKQLMNENEIKLIKEKINDSRLFNQGEEIQDLTQKFVKFMEMYVQGNNKNLTFHQLNASLKVDSGNEFIQMTFSLGLCLASIFFFLFTYILLRDLNQTFISDSHNLMSILTIQISFVNYLFQQRQIIEDMDKHEIDWRRVLEVNVISQSRLYLITRYGTIFVQIFITTTFIFLLQNLKQLSDQFIQIFQITSLLIPLFLILMPYKAFNQSMRQQVIKKILSLFLSPFVEVRFVDNILADGMTSLTKFIQSMIKMIKVFLNLIFDNKIAVNNNVDMNITNQPYISFTILIPFWIRLMQCLNKFQNTQELKHALNFIKYVTALAFIIVQLFESSFWVKFILGALATIQAQIWDIYVDWGVIQFDGKSGINLRSGKYSKNEQISSCIIDLVLRCVWIFTLMIETPNIVLLGMIDLQSVINITTINLEIQRRLLWAKYRIENETRLMNDKEDKLSVMMLQ